MSFWTGRACPKYVRSGNKVFPSVVIGLLVRLFLAEGDLLAATDPKHTEGIQSLVDELPPGKCSREYRWPLVRCGK